MPLMTLPNIIPTKGTMPMSLNWMRWINQTKIQVPKIAVENEKMARPHKVELGMKRSASKMPNWAEEMVAPVVGETNLFMHNCCIIRPATLIPTPVQRIASKRGRREIKKISSCSKSPVNKLYGSMSKTPMNSDHTDKTNKMTASKIVKPYLFIIKRSLLF